MDTLPSIDPGTGNRAMPASTRPLPDLYETPESLVRAVLRRERVPLSEAILEPAAGLGRMARVMRAAGYQVVATDLFDHDGADDDIVTGVDFLTADHRGMPRYVFTNPPFRRAAEFVKIAVAKYDWVAMILPLNFYARASTFELDLLTALYVFSPRPPRMHRHGWEGNEAGATQNMCAMVWDRGHRGSTIVERISWKDLVEEGDIAP